MPACPQLFVHTRVLAPSDFEAQPLDWESVYNFSTPFRSSPHGEDPGLNFTLDELKPGVRLIEAVKVIGDSNVPEGQLSWRAFVLPHRDPGVRDDPQLHSPTHRELPPYPFCKVGRSFDGMGRIAQQHYQEPQWTKATVHVANPDKLHVEWLGRTACFKRLCM